ncbi:hairy/enhancer-of-split related with YRPW motif protein 1-like isoform X1 [Asterias rubens]|uniref:hairy/enhancer-of-split related with YRPW motif protein 1-like isoform X1 n=1 Tax=Asterias rubens TaxID=7604 RepID=UPI001455B822|nr:hairy/enhancer-of-split related with YRPW motif protein 1-like isoform X1 [Asterias rubens]
MKRTLSDSDTDEIFDDSIKGSPSQSCPVTARKKRRGIIEKRRRDRINNSLTELRRLVPAAYEKQGSAKLEKAEILQMTVDHLKYLHAKGKHGIDGSFHPYGEAHAYAMDYRVLGFRECASEVARYMVTVEGMDIQDPLRLRLMSHLQCYMAQREFQSRQHYSVPGHPHSQFTSHAAAHGQTGVLPHGQHNAVTDASHGPPLTSGVQITDTSTAGRQMIPMITSSSQEASSLTSCHARLPMPPSTAASVPVNSSVSAQISPPVAPIQSLHTQYPGVTYNSLPVLSPNGFSPTSSSHMTHSAIMSKPYRPWGAENMVY